MSTKKNNQKKNPHLRQSLIYITYIHIYRYVYILGGTVVFRCWTVFVDSVVTVFFLPWSECNPVIYYFLKNKKETHKLTIPVSQVAHTTTTTTPFLPAYSETHT